MLLLIQNPESIYLLMISFAQASVFRPEVLVTAGSGRVEDEHWRNPTIIEISDTEKYSLSFYQDRYNTGCNTVPKLREHRVTSNALTVQEQMNPGLWTCSCKSETVNIWSLEESSLESWAELVYTVMKRTKHTCSKFKSPHMLSKQR